MTAGIYLHIPFCKSRCSYCDFATDVYRDSAAVDRYVAAICRDIDMFVPHVPGVPPFHSETRNKMQADTIYFGGGTPSLLAPEQVGSILDAVDLRFEIAPDTEITMEMNPATVTPESLAAYRSLGVNRASFGVQTFNDRGLKLLARGHDANDARNTFTMLREAGFDNISFDLIAGLPGQPMDDWETNLGEAVALSPEHISLYLLEIHSGTPLAEQVRSGRQAEPDPELAAEMYELMLDRLAAARYEHYEISNFSRCGFESRHNSKYWTLDPVFGFGVSAHSFDGVERYANERDTANYVEMIESTSGAEIMRESIDVASEFVFLGLRMERGIDLSRYEQRFDRDLLDTYRYGIEDAISNQLLTISDGNLRLTRKGKLFSNEVFALFV